MPQIRLIKTVRIAYSGETKTKTKCKLLTWLFMSKKFISYAKHGAVLTVRALDFSFHLQRPPGWLRGKRITGPDNENSWKLKE